MAQQNQSGSDTRGDKRVPTGVGPQDAQKPDGDKSSAQRVADQGKPGAQTGVAGTNAGGSGPDSGNPGGNNPGSVRKSDISGARDLDSSEEGSGQRDDRSI